MSWIPLPIGVENFEDLRSKGYYYVDKTFFIKELIDMMGKENLFTMPRRFGKTLNMSMLRYFFEKSEKDHAELFQGLKIMDAGEEYLAHMGKYPVISISLKSMKQYSYNLAFEMLKKAIGEEYSRHWETVEKSGKLSEEKQERYLRLRDLKGTEADYADSLKFLSECLYTCTGQKSIILIDEYDVPLENAYFSGFYDRMVALIRSLFESALKTNDNLEFAVVTGCLRISKESIFTGLNNLKVISITSQTYAEHFGFTPGEVEQMLRDYGLEENLDTVQKWYDGYRFGDAEVYNPWSVINYVDSCYKDKHAFAKPYWSNTSSNSIVRNLVEHADIITPNITEASILTGMSILNSYSNEDIRSVVSSLRKIGPEKGIITSVPLSIGKLGNVAYEADDMRIFAYEDLCVSYPGSGDLFASLFLSLHLAGYSYFPSVRMSGEMTTRAIRYAKETKRERRMGISLVPVMNDIREVL